MNFDRLKLLAEYKQRAESAEAKLRELEMQEPGYFILTRDHTWFSVTKDQYLSNTEENRMCCYTKPFPAPKQEEK